MKNREYFINFFKNLKSDNFSGCFLIYGESGVGQNEFAKLIASKILSINTQNLRLYPDYFEISGKASKNQQISVLVIRNLIKKLTLSSHQGSYRVIIIKKIEDLTTEAANTLLKTLEEPNKKTIFLLTTNKIDKTLDTIKSRCFKVFLGPIDNKKMINNLSKMGFDKKISKEISLFSLGKTSQIKNIKNKNDFARKKQEIIKLFNIFFNSSLPECFEFSNKLGKDKKKAKKNLQYLVVFLHDLLLTKLSIYNINFIFLEKQYQLVSKKYSLNLLIRILSKVLEYENYFKYNVSCKLIYENICLLTLNEHERNISNKN